MIYIGYNNKSKLVVTQQFTYLDYILYALRQIILIS